MFSKTQTCYVTLLLNIHQRLPTAFRIEFKLIFLTLRPSGFLFLSISPESTPSTLLQLTPTIHLEFSDPPCCFPVSRDPTFLHPPGGMSCISCMWSPSLGFVRHVVRSILITATQDMYFCYPRFTDEEPETQSYSATCPR